MDLKQQGSVAQRPSICPQSGLLPGDVLLSVGCEELTPPITWAVKEHTALNLADMMKSVSQ